MGRIWKRSGRDLEIDTLTALQHSHQKIMKNQLNKQKKINSTFLMSILISSALFFYLPGAASGIANSELFSHAFGQEANTSKDTSSIDVSNDNAMMMTMMNNTKSQNLEKTNVPVTIPLIKGYVNGNEVFYITTEVSDERVATHLSNLTDSKVVYTPALKFIPENALAKIYEFKNGINGSGPQGFQPNVADSQPGDPAYSPLWRIHLVEWKPNVSATELKSESEIIKAQKDGLLTITPTDIIVNCPFVKWNGGELQVREDKMLDDTTAYGGGQVLNIDTENNKVTFVGHLGFAPNGDTIYYIATDASKMDVAADLGVIFVNKTGYTLNSGSSSDLFVFTNGITGTGPMGFQASIASSNIGDESYSPLWRIQTATWNDMSDAKLLTSIEQINSAASKGTLEVKIAGVVVNCPFVEVSDNNSP